MNGDMVAWGPARIARDLQFMGNATHKEKIAALGVAERAALLARSDRAGLRQLFRHVGGLILTGGWIGFGLPGWPLLLVIHGVLIVFLFTALHETIHETAFASPWLNRSVAVTAGFLLILPPRWFRAFHFAHHRHTNDPERDPELAGPPIANASDYWWRLTGVPVWSEHICGLLRIARGRSLESFVPKRAYRGVVREARWMLAGYTVLGIGSVATGSAVLFWLWVLPALMGQPFLRAYLMAEHSLCPHVSNMLENSRTTFTNAIVRTLAWNMPFHAEHHCYPNVPFHKLPDFHAHIRDHIGTTAEGYVAFHEEMLRDVRSPREASRSP